MTDDEIKQLKAKIKDEIAEIEGRLPALEERSKPVAPDGAIGRISRMEAINDQGLSEGALREAKVRLENLKGRLEKIDEEGFGLCSVCRQPIAFPRLLFLPDTDRCVNCA